LWLLLGQPVTPVLSEIKHLDCRAPVHADDLTDTARHDLGAAAVEINSANLRVSVRWHANVARCINIEIELVVRPDSQKFPAMRGGSRHCPAHNVQVRRCLPSSLA